MTTPTLHLSVDLSKLRGLHNAAPELERVLRAAAFQAGAHVQAEVVTRTPVDLGTLRNSIHLDVMGMGADITARVATGMEYALDMETGKVHGKPPRYKDLIPWVTRKLGLSGSEASSAAFLIARKITKTGRYRNEYHMFDEGLRVSEPYVVRTFEAAVASIVRSING